MKIVKTSKQIAKNSKSAAKASKPSAPHHHTVKPLSELASNPPSGVVGVLTQLTAGHGLDGAACWLGTKISESFLKGLAAGSYSPKAKKTSKFLVVLGQRMIHWKLLSLDGDTYTRIHPKDRIVLKDTPVKGSIRLLKKTYGADKVRLVESAELLKLAKTHKTDVSCDRVNDLDL